MLEVKGKEELVAGGGGEGKLVRGGGEGGACCWRWRGRRSLFLVGEGKEELGAKGGG